MILGVIQGFKFAPGLARSFFLTMKNTCDKNLPPIRIIQKTFGSKQTSI